MECIKTRGIVARRADYSEANCMLTLFTEDIGIASVAVYGVKSKKSKMKSASQILCFSEFVLQKKGGEIYRAESADIIESFYPISEDLQKLALSNYLCDAVYDMYSVNDREILPLLLNTLYAISYKNTDLSLAKAVFELKIMQFAGYEPNTYECLRCKKTANLDYFDFDGGFVCENCKDASAIRITDDIKMAIKYILDADLRKLFSFSVSDNVKKTLSLICEGYILSKSEKKYKSLEYYKKIL